MNLRLRSAFVFRTLPVLLAFIGPDCVAKADVFVFSERLGYTGAWTRYGSLADAQSGTNPIGPGGTVPQRDLAIYVTQGVGGDANLILTNWYASAGSPGSGNPNNTNYGFLQIYDSDGSTDSLVNGYWTDPSLTSFRMEVKGENAVFPVNDPSNPIDWARFGEQAGGAGSTTGGTFVEYALDLLMEGLAGSYNPGTGLYEATGDPTSVTGTFTAIFQNQGTDPTRNGFYAIDLAINMTNWAFGQGLTPDQTTLYSDVVAPEPASLLVWSALGLVGGAYGLRRRCWR